MSPLLTLVLHLAVVFALLVLSAPVTGAEAEPGKEGKRKNASSAKTILFIINGESNSGGFAKNSEAKPQEIGVRPALQILDNVGLASFQDLNIGVNNIIGHARLKNGTEHGFELAMANRVESDPFYGKPCYLVKTGQGGSTIAQWNVEGLYFQTFKQRIDSAKRLLKGREYQTVVLFSLGINDAIAGTDIKIWQDLVKQHFKHVRRELGNDTPIIMTRFMKHYAAVNTAIEDLDREDNHTYSVETADAPLRDANHWNYAGMKLVTDRMLDIITPRR